MHLQSTLINMEKPCAVDVPKANVIHNAKTALDAKRIGDTIIQTDTFKKEQVSLMEEILCAKRDQVPIFKNELGKSDVNTIFLESTYDDTWGSGLNFDGTINTKKDNWPGNNQLGKIL